MRQWRFLKSCRQAHEHDLMQDKEEAGSIRQTANRD